MTVLGAVTPFCHTVHWDVTCVCPADEVKTGRMNNDLEMSLVQLRPWWSVRPALIATLAVLVTLLVALLSRPELLDHSIAGLAGL